MENPRKYSPEQTRLRIHKWCDRRERTHWEVRGRLIEWGVPSDEREQILSELIENQTINEKRFAMAYTNDQFRFHHWGLRKIERSLLRKGVSERNVREALASISPASHDEAILELIRKKWNGLKDGDVRIKRMKVIRFLVGKGFEPSRVTELFSQFLNEIAPR